MRVWPLLGAGLLAVAAIQLAGALATHDGVGPFEYAAGGILVMLAAVAALRLGRRVVKRS